MSEATGTPVPTMRRNEIKGFHSDVADLLMELVNHYEVKWRRGQAGSVLLYPPDGVTQPIKVSQRRPAKQQMTYLLEWAAEHLSQRKVTDARIVALAKAKNSEEHPVEEKHVTSPAASDTNNDDDVTLMIPDRTGQHEREGTWEPYVTGDGRTLDHIETDGEWFRCVICRDTDEPFVSNSFAGVNGHFNSKHGRKLYTPDAQARRVDSTKYNRLVEQITEPIMALAEALDLDTKKDAKKVTALEAKIEKLEKAAAKDAEKYETLNKKYEEVQARLSLIQEAFRA
jgi:hypothetical protein